MGCSIPITCDGCDMAPGIGENGNWYIGGVDTGVKAQGPAGLDASEKDLSGSRGALVVFGKNPSLGLYYSSEIYLPGAHKYDIRIDRAISQNIAQWDTANFRTRLVTDGFYLMFGDARIANTACEIDYTATLKN